MLYFLLLSQRFSLSAPLRLPRVPTISFLYVTSGLSEVSKGRRAIRDCRSRILLSILRRINTGGRFPVACFLSGEQMPTSQHDPGPTDFGAIFLAFQEFNSLSVVCVGGLTHPFYFAFWVPPMEHQIIGAPKSEQGTQQTSSLSNVSIPTLTHLPLDAAFPSISEHTQLMEQ